MDNGLAERMIPVFKLLNYKGILRQLQSFSDNVSRCNFKISSGGWASVGLSGKTYISEHGCDEYKPETLRGVTVLDLYYIKLTDHVVLTEEQYKDYCIVAGIAKKNN